MNILGLHFGHDAGISLLQNGKLTRCLIRERHNRTKHSFSLDTAHIDLVLDDANLTVDDIDTVALTSAQNYEMVSGNKCGNFHTAGCRGLDLGKEKAH